MSRKLVVVVRPAALDSVWVSKEVEASLAAGKTPIAVDINATLTEAAPENPLKRMLADRIYIEERKDDPDGSPDEATLQSLVKSFRATRLESLRLRAAMAGVGVFALLSLPLRLSSWWRNSVPSKSRTPATPSFRTGPGLG